MEKNELENLSEKSKGKLDLLNELYKYIIGLGKSQANNRVILSWIDSEKEKLNEEIEINKK